MDVDELDHRKTNLSLKLLIFA